MDRLSLVKMTNKPERLSLVSHSRIGAYSRGEFLKARVGSFSGQALNCLASLKVTKIFVCNIDTFRVNIIKTTFIVAGKIS